MKRITTLCAVACAAASLLFAQPSGGQSPVVHEDDFQSYGTQANPPGWSDTSVGSSKPAANGLYKTWPDPKDATKKNVAYGTKQSSGKPEGRNPRVGTFSTLTTKSFAGKGRFEFRGRMLRTDDDGRIGVTFFSSYPEKDSYYLIGLWSPSSGTKLTMQLFSEGGVPVGVLDSGFTPIPDRWYSFLVQVDETTGATEIRARFWEASAKEPESFSIDARDTSASRPSSGRIGVWAAVKGDSYFDDFAAKSPVDHTPPVVTIKEPLDGAVVTVPSINVTGAADDAVSVSVNGRAAAIDTAAKTYELKAFELAEGLNEIVVVAKDEVGNAATVKVVVTLDTRAPALTVVAPVMNSCLDGTSVQLRGRVQDRAVASVKASLNGAAPVDAVLTPDRQTWSVTFDAMAESQHVASVEALDDRGHRAVASVTFRVDRTAPTIEISESGRPFAPSVLNRRVVPLIRLSDADPMARFMATLNGEPYVSGTEIADGKHRLYVTAIDCAAQKSDKSIDFEVDTEAPSILTITPADGSTHGTKPTISGTASPDGTTITVEPGGSAHPVTNGAFTLATVPLVDGVNELVLIVSDAAGHSSRKPYRITLKLSVPAVEITHNGVSIPEGALFNRAITPAIGATEGDVTIAATLDGAAYTVGTLISAEGAHTLKATASDVHGHTSEPATATFTIDTTRPQVSITVPAAGAAIPNAQVEVRGTVTGTDIASVRVNGVAATFASGAFSATIPLEAGPNTITATAVDRAGNAATAQVEITRGGTAPGIIVTAPADGTFTNRTTTIVAGHVLTPSAVSRVTINGQEVPVDPTGAFRKSGHILAEGENTITAAARNSDGMLNESTIRVTADLTAPRLRILESGQPLADESRFPERAVLSVEATDGGVAVVPEIFIDNAVQTSPHTVAVAGGHTITAIARDRAGNESRLQRTFFIGGVTAGGCVLEKFDPPHGSVVTSNTVTLAGRSGGAAGVKVNGTPALVSSGSFCATVELPAEGDNVLSITCTDAAGAPTGTPVTITLRRATGEPSITVTLPEEGKTTADETITVSGTAAGAATVEVNSVQASLNEGSFSISGVRLVPGLNVLSVVARSAAGRTSSASRRVLYLKDAPSLTITSPASSVTTGASTIDVSGLWSNLDPSTIAIVGATVSTTSFSDTSGSFIAASVPLATGQQTITVTGRDVPGRTTSAASSATLTAGHPSISITEPVDNHVFATTAGDTVVVRGSFNAQPGSSVEVGGVTATLDAPGSFSASVPLASGRLTPIVAHVTTVEGTSTVDAVRVSKAAAKPKVSESFPAANAVQVDAAVMPMVLFSAPMDRATTAAAFRLENAAGTAVSGTVRLDRDVLTFAPAALLTSGERYTLRLGTAARALSGDALEAEFTSAFIVAATAPRTPPVLSAVPGNVCGSTMPISGTAPAGARLRIDLGTLSFSTTASAAGAWSYQLPIGGSSGHQVVRVRITGTDGSLSAAAESCFVVDCNGPQVSGATFDRAANKLTVVFTKELKGSTATSSAFQLTLSDGRVVASTVALQAPAKSVVVTPAEDLGAKSFALTVTTAIEDTNGKKLAAPYTQQFALGDDGDPQPGDGSGYISGEVFDTETGRPLAGATIVVVDSALQSSSDSRGRYSFRVPEGAHTLGLSATGYTAAWRQVLVPAGVGVNPIDVRLTPVGAKASIASSELTLTHRDATLRIPAGGVTPGTEVALTRLGAQSLPGLLPLGWSPLRAAVVASVAPALSGAELTFAVPMQTITAASQTLTAVRYDQARDEWIVIAAVVNVANDKATVAISAPGAYALVYPDAAPRLARPPAALAGAPLQSAVNPCAVTPCPDLTSKSFTLEPRVIVPSEKALVTLNVEGLAPAVYSSGTAVQAHVAEELKLADGSRMSDPPFTTDLLLYRSLMGDVAVAEFQLAPSVLASQVVLDVGFDHINVLPYPGRLDRGTLVGIEGGKVPGDGRVTVEIPAGATTEAIHASTASISDLAQFGTIAGFEIVAGFTLTMQRAAQPQLPEGMTAPSVELLQPAKATFAAAQTSATQLILAEVLDATPYGRLFRLASRITVLDASRVTTRPIDRATLPLDGIVREGRYLLLKATAPIAFATGSVKTTSGTVITDARVTTPPLGVTDITRTSGLFNVTVPAGATPFTLVPRSVASGDGATYTHASGTAADSIVVVDLPLVGQPPQLTATEPAANATEVVLAPIVKATFAPGIDPTSVTATSIVVTDTSNGAVVPGRVSAQGTLAVIWTLPAGERLLPNRRYAVTIAPWIRGSNGAPFGVSHVFSFSTITQLASGEVHAEKIRITIPDAKGQSRVTGDAGALPAGWNAVAVRRGVDFVTRFQANAASDGTFAFTITERVALSDTIDLQVVNATGSVAAIIPLAPFVTENGLGFVAPADRTVTFNAANGVSVTTEAGTFDEPTVVTIADAPKAIFESVPNFATEINFISGLAITFDGTAKRPLEVSIPIPAGTGTDGRNFLLGRLGDSARGPRIEIGDTLRVANGKFTTTEAAAGGSMRVQTLETTTGRKVKDYLLRIVHGAGEWAVIDLNTGGAPLGFAQVNGLAGNLDLFFSSYQSLYCSNYYLTASRGRAVFPFLAGTKFVVEGVDSGTGLNVFSKGYDGVPLPPAGGFSAIDSPMPNESGPYPVFGNPFFVHVVDVDAIGVKLVVTREMSVELPDATPAATEVIIARTGLEPARFGAINVTQSKHLEIPEKSSGTGTLGAALGDRLIVYGSAADVAPTGTLEIVFNEAIEYGGDVANLASLVRLDKDEGSVWVPVPVNYEADSGNRRIAIVLRGELQRGGKYRLTLDASIPDAVEAPNTKTLGFDVVLPFTVREPRGKLAAVTIPDGSIRDMALDGNLLFVAATDGDLLAYDVSNPAALDTAAPIARASATAGTPTDIPGDTWSVTVDHHGRIWTTALTDTFGVIRSFRVEDFIPTIPNQVRAAPQVAAGIVSWRPGINAGLPLGTTWTTSSDRAEGIPRKMQIAVQDESFRARGGNEWSEFANASPGNSLGATVTYAGAAGVSNEFSVYSITVPRTNNSTCFRQQRVTVRNRTLGLRWSGEILGTPSSDPAVPCEGSVTIDHVLVRDGDEIEVLRNYGTYAVVTLFGYGIGFYDLNAMEHNQRLPLPDKQYAMQLALTEGRVMHPIVPTMEAPPCDAAAQPAGYPCPPRALTFATDTAVVPNAAGFALYPVETRSGIVTVTVDPIAGSQESNGSDPSALTTILPFAQNGAQVKRSVSDHLIFTGGTGGSANDHPRLKPIRDAFAANGRVPATRFTNIERFDVGPKTYGLVAANQFGLLVVDLAAPIGANALADVIWAPAGIYGVRHVRGTHFATAVDGQGRTLLIDLSRVDERSEAASIASCTGNDCLFPTLRKALSVGPDMSDTRGWSFGAWDPRIIWRSAKDSERVNGTLAPVADPDTGFIFNGELTQKTIDVLHGIDPRMRVRADLGGFGALSEVGAVVPAGIDPPRDVIGGPGGTLAVFKIDMYLPAGTTASGVIPMAIESERVIGAVVPQMPAGLPPSRISLSLRRAIPQTALAASANLKYQRGANLWESSWVRVIADPRASTRYTAASDAERLAAGCDSCGSPSWLPADALEVWSGGRWLRIRVDGTIPGYDYLSHDNRLSGRIGTVIADTSRPADIKLAAQDPSPAGARRENIVNLHTGEVEFVASDLPIRGRGLDFVLTRTYNSAVFSLGPLGRGIDSSLFARLRALPNGDIDYFNGSGRRDRFSSKGDGTFTPPPGVFVDLSHRSDNTYVLVHSDRTQLVFDTLGRLAAINDRNRTKTDRTDGNTMHFIYRADGLLDAVIDPTGRKIALNYWPESDLLRTVTDFEGRTVMYAYDSACRLVKVIGPDPQSALSAQQTTNFAWTPAPINGDLKQVVYQGGQLSSAIDGMARTVFTVGYQASSKPWAATTLTTGGGTWQFAPGEAQMTVVDPHAKTWIYTHDASGNITSVTAPAAGTSVLATTIYGFDEQQRLTSITRPMGDAIRYTFGGGGEGRARKLANLTQITVTPRAGSAEAAAGMTRTTTIHYGTANQPVKIVAPGGATTTIDRDERGNPRAVTEPTGVMLTSQHDERGLLREVIGPHSGTTTYGYDARGYPAFVTRGGATTTLSVDARGNITRAVDPSGRRASFTFNKLDQLETESRGNSAARNGYDAAGNLVRREQLAGLDSAGNPIYETTQLSVDELGRVQSQSIGAQVLTTRYDATGNPERLEATGTAATSYRYDARGRIETLTMGSRTTTHFYDDNGQPASVRDARGNVTTFHTGGFGEAVGQTGANGISTVSTHDEAGRPVDVRVIKTTADGKQLLLRWTRREYDASGRMTKDVGKLFVAPLPIPDTGDPSGATDIVTQWIHDDVARKVTIVDPRGGATTTEMDEEGRPVRTVDSLGNMTLTEYHANGTRASQTRVGIEPDGTTVTFKTLFEYDEENRLAALIDASDPTRPLHTRFRYDARGNRIAVVDAEGRETRFEHDLRGRLVKTIDPEGGETTQTWDEASRLVILKDANGNETEWFYDADGNLERERRADGAEWKFTYDENHNVATATDANGTVTTFYYDSMDRVVETRIAKAPGVGGPSIVKYKLDDLGRIIATETDEGVRETFTYDSLDRQLSESVQLGTGPRQEVKRAFDAASNVTLVTYPSGLVVTREFDPLGRPTDISAAGTAVVGYSYSGAGVASKALFNGLAQTFRYDLNGHLSSILSSHTAGPSIHYTRSRTGNKSSVSRPDLEKQWNYTYDGRGWMTREEIVRPRVDNNALLMAIDYSADALLNYRQITRLTQTAETTATTSTAAAFNVRNQHSNFAGETLSYDRSGNLRQWGTRMLEHDAAARLTKATTAAVAVEAVYAASGRKVRETSGGVTREYVHDGVQVIEEHSGGALSARYVRGAGVDEMVRAELGGTTLVSIQDELGTVHALTNEEGELVERYEYEGYGNLSVFAPSASTPSASSSHGWRHFFQGREYHATHGVYDFRARALWPALGRFSSEDPSGFGDSMNLYQALVGNPQNATDPSGEVVVLMHGIQSSGQWGPDVAAGLAESWGYQEADQGQDVVNLVNRRIDWSIRSGDVSRRPFNLINALNAARIGYLDADTQRAGTDTMIAFALLRATLDASRWRKGEPLHVIAHSHGTAILLAAARQNEPLRFALGTATLVGSDLHPQIDLTPLFRSALVTYNYYSHADTTAGMVSAAGNLGFREGGVGPVHMRPLRPDTSYFDQRREYGDAHTSAEKVFTFASTAWMTYDMAVRRYGYHTPVYAARPGPEPAAWIGRYEQLRQMIGLAPDWTIPLSEYFRQAYPRR